MTTDAVLRIDENTGLYDINIGADGDIETADFFDTAILYSIFGEKRASSDEVVEPQLRRGWIGNDDFENGSKIWLFSQARLTRSVINRIEDEAMRSLEWLVEDGLAVSIDQASVNFSDGKLALSLTIRRSRDKVERRLFTLWENTGNVN